MLVKILKPFPFSKDGKTPIPAEKDAIIDIPDALVAGLRAEGYVGAAPQGEKEPPAQQPQETPEERAARETAEEAARQAAEEDARRKAAGELAGQVEAMEWNDFIGKAVEILGKDARTMKKAEVVEALKKAAEPPAPIA